MNSEKIKKLKEYYEKQIINFDETTLIAPNKNGKKEEGITRKVTHELPNNTTEFCENNEIEENELFLASLLLALNKFNFSCENLIFYDENIPFSAKYENRSITIKEYINSIKKTLKENQNHPYESINELLNEYNLKPEFYYSYNKNIPSNTDYSNYLNISHSNEKIIFSLLFNGKLYTKKYIEIFLESIEKIIKQIITSEIDKISISDIAIENENENIAFSEIQNPILHKRFEMQVKEKPNEIALVASDKTLTYNELNEKSNRIANALIKRGVETGNNILVMLKRDSNLIASIIGILKAGCTFIPIDLEYPQERIDYIYENSQADYIISNANEGNSIDVNELLKEEDTSNPNVNVHPEDNAYMIYTSGSTGLPKGVVIGHENACNEAEGNPKCEYNSILSIATIAFDTSLEDILTGITNGIKIIFANDNEIKNIIDLVQLIKQNKPEVMEFTPSRLLSYLEVEEFCNAIDCAKCIVMGGEQFSAKAFTGVKQYTNAKVYNSYGPTETTIASSYKEIHDPENITIGKALQNYITEVRDIDGKLLPQGVMGELYIGGTGVGKGYYNMPEKTKEVFLEINNIPYYKSGDYAIETTDGEIDIKGRIDNQIKLRGLRIEIGEIETNISKYPNIKQNVVVIKEINNNDHLCAYFTAEQQINTDDLKEFLKERLTRYMVPTVFMQIDEMPQTPNGKTDLKQLPEPELKLSYTLPETETEHRLFDIASSICETTEFGINDDLYSLGFSSLTLMKFNARIYEQIGANLNITAILNEPTIKNIAKQIDNTQTDSTNLKKLVESSKDRVYYPLTSNQLGVYYECIQSSEEAHYNLPSIIRFDSDIDAEKLKTSIVKTIEAYPYLKTRIISKNGELMQKRDDSIAIDEIPIIEIDEISPEEIEKENVKTFPLENSQLFRFKIYKTPDETVLFSDFHHIITDGESLDKFFKNIANAYQNKEIEKENIDGYLNSLIEKEYESSEEYEKSRTYFQSKLTQDVESTILTPDLNGNEEEGKLKSISKNIKPEQIRQFCSEKGISPNVLIMASTILNLNKYTFSNKTLITTIFNGRTNSNYFNTQAFLVKTLPIISIDENRFLTIKRLLENVDEIWKETINHSNYPYTEIAEEFQLKPEFFYSYNNLDDEILEINNKNYRVNYLDTIETNYKLTFDVNETENDLEFLITYNDQLYSEEHVETFLDCILNILNQFISEDIEKLMIKDIELNKSKVIPTLTPLDTPILHERFEKQVEEKPNETALVASDMTLTYNELNEKSNRIANALIKRGVEAGNNILVMLKRDSNLIASIIGILKAGCAFIPIDLEYPQERIDYIYENSQADYIISNTNEGNSIDVNELLKEENAENPNINVNPNDTAYMIYTSGSTGKPKGVMIGHENISNQVQNPKSQYESLLCLATISFDVSVDDILTSLSNGRKLILASDSQIKNIPELIDLINETKPEVSEITPSRLASYLEVEEFCEAIKCIKCLLLGGEQFSAKVYEEFRKYSDAIVYNSYGPTETTITSNNKEITDINDITVGKPLENYVTEVRDIDGKLLPQGVMGELYIGGTGVGKGYYNMPEKTKEVFLEINNIPYYKSGDYAIETPNGEIDIKGRIDDQIKLRGLRIEIGEIETNISRYPNIKQNVVVIKQINNNDHLCAYFTADQQINTDDLKDFLKDKLTKYMIPTVFMQIDEMPQTPNGKTDLKKLPKPILKLENVKPENETEEKLFKITSELIGTDKFGTTDDLYTIGYTSLTLMKLNSLIYEKMNVNLDISVLFNAPTIKKLSEEINANDNDDTYIDELIEMAGKLEYFPLTENQLGIYYECMQSPTEIKYTMPTTIRFGKEIDVDKLKESLIKVIESHPYIKTRIITTEDGTLKQHRNDNIKPNEIEIVKTS
ncbi:amino acid adenylation domain-containing protein, partial [Methanobrevibacter sp.]|uniref:amino acid adenylation domain-containing protein n=1 Tax=Methanobrevibacter sp. TaxID=66852 RepID=UPI00388D99AC